MRRGPGLSALSRHSATTAQYSSLSSSISQSQLAALSTSLAQFRESLQAFAQKHRDDIRRDPAFRHQFQKMCAAIGVDPLQAQAGGATGASGAWSRLGLGEWTYELAVQIVDVCVSTRALNGGLVELRDLIRRVERMRGQAGVTPADVERSIALLDPLRAGYAIVDLGGTRYVRSVPRELDTDQGILLVLAASAGGRVTPAAVKAHTGWTDVRARAAVDNCIMRDGLGWVDEQDSASGGGQVVWILAAVEFDA